MKCIFRRTGEKVKVVRWGQDGRFTDYINEKGEMMRTELNFYDNFERINDADDWETFRRNAALAILQAMITNQSAYEQYCELSDDGDKIAKLMAGSALLHADKLIDV